MAEQKTGEGIKEEKQNSGKGGVVSLYIMGEKFEVPDSLTIQKAMEFAGYQLIRGSGCRGGICGSCATVYRMPGSYRIEVGLACQTVVKEGMYLAQIPFFPAHKASYELEKLKPEGSILASFYPELFKCIGCGTCTRSCPMDIEVMEYVSEALRGNVARVAELSFDCVMCGLCAARCPAEEVQYNIAILCRRLYGRHIAPGAKHAEEADKQIREGKFDDALKELKSMDGKKLKKTYVEREIEPAMADEFWTPENKDFL